MRPIHQTLSLIAYVLVSLHGAGALAAEVADGGQSRAPRTEASPRALGPSDASRLIAGNIPSLSRLDTKYRQAGTTARCEQTWRQFRNKPVRMRTVGVSLNRLFANADRANLSRRKVQNALAIYLKNQAQLPNQRYLTIVDFDKPSSQPRLFTIDLSSGRIDAFHVSSSYGSSPTANGYSTHFSNKVDESNANSLGCAVASGEYSGRFGRRSLVLHGIESSNDNTCRRSIIMHGANYVGKGASRSEGCLAVKNSQMDLIADRVGSGGLICSYREGALYQARGNYKKSARRRHAYQAPAPRTSHWGLHDLF